MADGFDVTMSFHIEMLIIGFSHTVFSLSVCESLIFLGLIPALPVIKFTFFVSLLT